MGTSTQQLWVSVTGQEWEVRQRGGRRFSQLPAGGPGQIYGPANDMLKENARRGRKIGCGPICISAMLELRSEVCDGCSNTQTAPPPPHDIYKQLFADVHLKHILSHFQVDLCGIFPICDFCVLFFFLKTRYHHPHASCLQ